MRRFASLLFIAFAALPAAAEAEPLSLTPAQLGEVFCISRLAGDAGPIEGLLTPAFAAAIAEAEEHNAAIQSAHPDEKPPLGDGIPWQSAPDYAARCTAGTVDISGDVATVAIGYGFPDYPEADFTDTLQLRPVADPLGGSPRWRIDNVAYADGEDLRAALVSAFTH